jgi:hypothetical protein
MLWFGMVENILCTVLFHALLGCVMTCPQMVCHIYVPSLIRMGHARGSDKEVAPSVFCVSVIWGFGNFFPSLIN